MAVSNKNLERLADVLVMYRLKYSIPQKDLAARLRISMSTLNELERHHSATDKTLAKILAWLLMDPEGVRRADKDYDDERTA